MPSEKFNEPSAATAANIKRLSPVAHELQSPCMLGDAILSIKA